jgi:hypothetical protein
MQNYTDLHSPMNEINGYYNIAIHPTRINYYYTPFERKHKSKINATTNAEACDMAEGSFVYRDTMAQNRPEQFGDNSHHGKVSKLAAAKIARAVDYLVYLSQPKKLPHTLHGKDLSFRLNFLTLTLSSEQIHSDHEIMSRIFRPFLMALDRKWKVGNYIWRAEKQANGSLHYHIVTDKFIPWNELRNVWNRCQQNLGYVTRYRENQILWHRDGFRCREELVAQWPRSKQIKAFHDGQLHDWNSPNSTDVHSLKLINNVKAYFVKYMTKSGQSSDIAGRLWGCSVQLSRISGAQVAIYNKIEEDLDKIKANQSVKVFQSDFFTIIFITIMQLTQLGCTEMLLIWEEFLSVKFTMYRPPTLAL